MKRIAYTETADYIPKEIRKALKLGEFSDEIKPEKTSGKKTKEPKPKTRGKDEKGRYVMVNGKKCYSQAEVEAQLKESLDTD